MVERILATQVAGARSKLLLAVTLAPKEIGKRIAAARIAKGWTQLEFATEHAHVSPSSVARWEAGGLPPVRELMRIAAILGVAVDTLVENEAVEGGIEALRAELAETRRERAEDRETLTRIEALLSELRELNQRRIADKQSPSPRERRRGAV